MFGRSHTIKPTASEAQNLFFTKAKQGSTGAGTGGTAGSAAAGKRLYRYSHMIITLGIAVKCLFSLAIMTVTLVTIAAGVLLALPYCTWTPESES